MSETKLISPGIPNYTLKRNLRLNDNYISNDGGDEGIRVDDDGNVGIKKVPAGSYALDVSGHIILSERLYLANTKALSIGGRQVLEADSSANNIVTITSHSGWNGGTIYIPALRKVCIGANDPGSSLDVRGPAGTGAASAGVLTLSTEETSVRVGTVDQLGRIDFQAPKEGGGTDAILVGASIHAECEEDFASDNNSTGLVFSTGTTTVPIERMRIDQDGNVGIGVDDPDALLEIFGTSTQLKLSHNTADYATLSVANSGDLTIATVGDGSLDSDLILDVDGNIAFDADAGQVEFDNAGTTFGQVYMGTTDLFQVNASVNYEMKLQSSGTGETTIVSGTGGVTIDSGGHVKFEDCGVGFNQLTVTFGASAVIGDSGNSTDVDFRLGNKAWLELTGNLGTLNNINLIFPAVSGNFVLVLEQDGTGSRTIHANAWEGNMYTSDGSTKATVDDPLWAGGSAPTLTTNVDYFDIISFYWDATNGRVFAVPTLNFS